MRGRILTAVFLATAALAACGRRDSIYIDPGKEAPPDAGPPKAGTGEPVGRPATAPGANAPAPAPET